MFNTSHSSYNPQKCSGGFLSSPPPPFPRVPLLVTVVLTCTVLMTDDAEHPHESNLCLLTFNGKIVTQIIGSFLKTGLLF